MTLPVHITGPRDHDIDEPHTFTVNRANKGDRRVVISWSHPGAFRKAAGFSPIQARNMAAALVAAADVIE